MLLSHYDLTSEMQLDNSAAYIQGWIKPLKDNPKWLVSANSKAKAAVKYILGGKAND